MSMENQKILDVVVLAAHLHAVARKEIEIISVSYDKHSLSFSFRPGVNVHVGSPKMVDAVSDCAKIRRFGLSDVEYFAKISNVKVFAILTIEKAMEHTGMSREEIVKLLEDNNNGDDLY